MFLTSGFNSKAWDFDPITWMVAFIIIGKLKFLDNNVFLINKVRYVENKLHFLSNKRNL